MRVRVVAVSTLLLALVTGCSWHELRLSRTLKPVLTDPEVNFPMTSFRARVQMGVLEVWGRVKRVDAEYAATFDLELASASTLCAALARSPLTFREDWRELRLELTSEYGSQWRWQNTWAFARIRISRDALRALRDSGSAANGCAQQGQLYAVKVGPPDYVPYEWPHTPAAQ